MKFAVIVFPGSNCDQDAYHAATTVLGQTAELVWHKSSDLKGADVVILPGGFAHGILLETGLLPGAMLKNRGLKYVCEHVHVRVEQIDTPFTAAARVGQVLRIPIGHGEGNYYAPPEVVQRLEANRQVILRYTTPDGRLDDSANPNGSVNAIAGLCNERRNVVGMMPHPERACERPLGSVDGLVILQSILSAFASDQPRGSHIPPLLAAGAGGTLGPSTRP
jgi:phosphoribosylformylglycinamidine synthase